MGNNKIKNSTKKKYKKYLVFFFIKFFNLIYGINSLHFSIDNRVSVAPSDCYQRVSIGSRLPDSLIISTFEANAISDCEAACSANGTFCGSFGFGVGLRGNSTCMLGQRIQSNQDNLIEDRDYDVYVKGHISLLGCLIKSDKSFEIIPSLLKTQMKINDNKSMPILMINDNPEQIFGNNSLLNFLKSSSLSSISKNQSSDIENSNNNDNNNNININPLLSQQSPGSFLFPKNDDQIGVYDILRNKQGHHQYLEDDYDDKIDELNFFPSLHHKFGIEDYDGNVHNIGPLKRKNGINLNKKNIDINNNDNNYNNFIAQKVIEKNNGEIFSTDPLDFSQFGRRLNVRPTFVFDKNYDNSWLNSDAENAFLFDNLEKPEELEIIVTNSFKGEKGKKVMTVITKSNNDE